MSSQASESVERSAIANANERGVLSLQFCPACDRWTWFPRVACPACFSGALEWRDASGEGRLLSVAVVQRTHHTDYEEHVPIVLVLILLDEGCEMVSTIVGENRLEAKIGARVRVASEGRWSTLPQFELAAAT
jgi:uncharacterized OB-fold protein